MTTGKQLAALLLLTTALSFPGLALAQDTDEDSLLDDVSGVADDQSAEDEAPDISIPGGTIIVTGRRNADPTRNSSQVISVLTNEEIARTGAGDIAGALGRVTGLSVVGNGRVYVRGLGDRYSLAMLNGLPLPSPEPLSRVVPLDIFPTNVVASSLVQKTYSPNFPGEFGGGVINLTTRAVPDESYLTISGGVSGDTETTFQNGYSYYGSGGDWTGYDTGARAIPSVLSNYLSNTIVLPNYASSLTQAQTEDIARVLTPPQFATLQIIGKQRVNFSAGLTAGTAIDVNDDTRLGLVFTGGIKNNLRNRDIARQTAAAVATTYQKDENDFVTDERILVNGMFSAGLEIGDHTIRWTNLLIRDTVKRASLADFKDYDPDRVNYDYLRQNTSWFERQLLDTQLVGEFDFDQIKMDLRGGFARTKREAPYNLTYTYVRTNTGGILGDSYQVVLPVNAGGGTGSGVSVSFSDLYENLWFGGIDLTYEPSYNFSATVGYAYSDTYRYTESRRLRIGANIDPNFYNPDNNPDIPDVDLQQALQLILGYAGLRSPALLFNATTFNMFDVSFVDETITQPAFSAALTVHGAYGQFQWLPIDTVTVQGGVRFESGDQTSTPIGVSNAGTPGRNKQEYWLPGATVTWQAMDDLQLRVSGSKTIARPQFRELIAQTYFDPESSRSYSGNPALVDSELLNFEARAEYYFDRRSRASLAGFYKKIDNPIEAFLSSDTISYANAPSATLYGGEVDLQYNFDLESLGGWFETKQLVFLGNYTYTQSDVSVGSETVLITNGSNIIPIAASALFDDGSPLIGQSDHLVNLQLGIEDLDKLQQFTALFSYASARSSFRNANPMPDTIEKPGFNLDLVARQGITLAGLEAEIKLEGRNLLGTRHQEFVVNNSGLRIEENTYDVGRSFAASLSVTF